MNTLRPLAASLAIQSTHRPLYLGESNAIATYKCRITGQARKDTKNKNMKPIDFLETKEKKKSINIFLDILNVKCQYVKVITLELLLSYPSLDQYNVLMLSRAYKQVSCIPCLSCNHYISFLLYQYFSHRTEFLVGGLSSLGRKIFFSKIIVACN